MRGPIAIAITIAIAAACGGRRPAESTGGIENRVPGRKLVLEVSHLPREPEEGSECSVHDLAIRAMDGDRVVGEHVIDGTCSGACTAEEQKAGAAALAEAEAKVDAGETASLLDYNFTDCIELVANQGDVEPVAGEEIEIVTGEHAGPHDVPNRYFRLAMIACGALFVGDEFGATYTNRWEIVDLNVEQTRDGLVVHVTEADQRVELYRVVVDCAKGVEGTVLPTGW